MYLSIHNVTHLKIDANNCANANTRRLVILAKECNLATGELVAVEHEIVLFADDCTIHIDRVFNGDQREVIEA